ncbi:MAG: cupin domain-containing protein [Parvularculaceae bacterium]|nr:cupin domain-containing protein [Parvularculaceae bacterium]
MVRKINIPSAFGRISETWQPHLAGQVNGQDVRLARIEGAFEFHRHAGVEEAFFVVRGRFVMRFRDHEVPMEEGDFLVVPADTDHMPVAAEECWVMLIETAGERNTGDKVTARTRRDIPVL